MPNVETLREYDGEDKIISSFEADLSFKKSSEPVFKVRSGFPTLDRHLEGGFEGGRTIRGQWPDKAWEDPLLSIPERQP